MSDHPDLTVRVVPFSGEFGGPGTAAHTLGEIDETRQNDDVAGPTAPPRLTPPSTDNSARAPLIHINDPDGLLIRRATRVAIVMPILFWVFFILLDQPVMALFASFASFALLAMGDFGGELPRLQLRAHPAVEEQHALAESFEKPAGHEGEGRFSR